jgi:GH15 family glucan-1,4-alpha-glucosidase
MKKLMIVLAAASFLVSCKPGSEKNEKLKKSVMENTDFKFVKKKALEVVKTGFNAGDGYGEVWIRDYATFIELSAEVYPKEILKENLRVFFRLQGNDGNIIDGFIPKEKAVNVEGGYTYIYNDLEPTYCGHKNTVETDHEASLVQAVYKYIQKTGDKDFLQEKIGEKSVLDRMELSMEFLLNHRWSKEHGMIWGATTSDWGDVQHCHPWGVYITEDTKYCIDIYDNAMFLIAISDLMELDASKKEKWQTIHDELAKNTMKYLWDNQNQKFIPHVYLDGSPFPKDFNENEIFYHGGTAVAIEAGLLNKDQIKVSLDKMIANVKASGAGSIGLTMYPPYPEGFFENKGMYPYGYQNGGDWTWFGGRMIQQLVKYGFVEEAYEQLIPMTKRVVVNDGFYEWYTEKNEPKGSGTFRGSAGVLYKAIEMLEDAVEK